MVPGQHTMETKQTVLLTGATGFVGRELLWRLVKVRENQVLCLVRAQDSAQANGRLQKLLDQSQPEPLTPEQRSRVRATAADLTKPGLGLSEAEWNQIAGDTHRIIHGAASVDWAQPLDIARSINVEGTRRMIELAKAAQACGGLRSFEYLSTCYVCGRRTGVIAESDLNDGYGFFNSYEQSKCEAEKLVRSSGLPYYVFRLSMVVGDSRSGYASTFKVMYWPLKMLSRGMAKVVPGDPRGVVDLVPVDYVCDAIEALAADPEQSGKTFHLAAGPGRSSTVGEMIDLAVRRFQVSPPWLIPQRYFDLFIRPILYLVVGSKKKALLKKGRIYRPYFAYGAAFDTSQVRAVLDPARIAPPPVQDYFLRLIDYAIASDWGKAAVEAK